jgi:REP element-mobilizing transposase RayT
MLRGNGGQRIFFTEEDYAYLYALLEEGTGRFGYRIHAFCCMPNHLHLAVQVGEEPLSKPMQNLAFRYTRRIHREQQRTGHLFQGRYKAVLVDHDSYLLELVRYLHLNPVRAHLVDAVEAYPWSSHRAYLGQERLTWLTTDWVLGQFGSRGPVARGRYVRFVGEGIDEGHRPEFHAGPEDSRVLGEAQLTQAVSSAEVRLLSARVSLEGVMAAVCEAYALTQTDLVAAGQGRRISEARAAVGTLTADLRCSSLAEVGRRLGREESTISSAVRRLRQRAVQERALGDRLEALRSQLLGEVASLQD